MTNPPHAWVRAPSSAPATSPGATSPGAAPAATVPPSYPPPPEPPDGYYSDDIRGAERAAMHFLNLYAYAFQTGNTAPLQEISAPECEYCTETLDRVEEYRKSGQTITGGDFTFESVIGIPPEGDRNHYLVHAFVLQGQGDVANNGIVIHSTPVEEVELAVGVAHSSGEWKVVVVGIADPEEN